MLPSSEAPCFQRIPGGQVRFITEDAEPSEVAENGDNALARGTSALRDLKGLRFLRVKAGRAGRTNFQAMQ